jgi:hypothetical protein
MVGDEVAAMLEKHDIVHSLLHGVTYDADPQLPAAQRMAAYATGARHRPAREPGLGRNDDRGPREERRTTTGCRRRNGLRWVAVARPC